MAQCPYNESIECDNKSRNAEFTRQLNIVLRSGGFWFDSANKSPDCRAKSGMCTRLAAEKARPTINARICCPYDGNVCATKKENWEIVCKDLAAHRIPVSLVYKESDTSLHNCPRIEAEMQKCERYQRYLAAQKAAHTK